MVSQMRYSIHFEVPDHLDHLWSPDGQRAKYLHDKVAEFLQGLVMLEITNEVDRLRIEPRIEREGGKPD